MIAIRKFWKSANKVVLERELSWRALKQIKSYWREREEREGDSSPAGERGERALLLEREERELSWRALSQRRTFDWKRRRLESNS